MKKLSRETRADAAKRYAARASDIARLIDVLQMELERHAAAARSHPRIWGMAGDLDLVRSNLIDTVAFISGSGGAKMEREDVERFLAEAE